jgi:hypothetical protein
MATKKASKKRAAAGGRKNAKKSATKKSVSKKAAAKKAAKSAAKKSAAKAPQGGAVMAPGGVFIINMIPKALSGEANQDSEPHLTVNPSNPNQIVGTAFTPDPGGGANAPIYASNDGGNTWSLNSIVPSAPGSGSGTGDITTGLNRAATKLYGAILRNPTGNQEFLRTNNFNAPTPMSILASRPSADQPFTHTTTVTSGPDAGRDRVYIGNNDFAAPGGRTATIDHALNAAASNPVFNSIRIEKRSTMGQDGPQVRPVTHRNGLTVYAIFYRWVASTGSFGANTLIITSADVVVVRDDNGGKGANPYTSLVDAGDGLPGVRVVKNVSFPFMRNGTAQTGQQRIGGSLSIAVDPNDKNKVYIAWGDKPASSSFMQTLHVRRSLNGGQTWSADLLTVQSATNAALAINNAGKVAFLFQQLRGLPGDPRWVTRVMRSVDGVNWSDLILANTSATNPAKIFDPYIGDYDHLVAIGKDFYGIFSASNVPNMANFPNGVKYQRNADFSTRRLLRLDNTTIVQPSIDPFFFKLTE